MRLPLTTDTAQPSLLIERKPGPKVNELDALYPGEIVRDQRNAGLLERALRHPELLSPGLLSS